MNQRQDISSPEKKRCPKQLRILGYTPRYLPLAGGAEYGLRELYVRLAGKADLTLLTPLYHNADEYSGRDSYFSGEGTFRIIRYKRFPLWMERWTERSEPVRKCVSLLGQVSTALHVAWNAFRLKPDVIHLNYLVSSYPSARLLKWLGIRAPIVLSLIGRPDVFADDNEDYRRYRRVFDWMHARVDAGIYQTPSVMGKMPSDARWIRIPYGVKTDELPPAPPRNAPRLHWGTLSRLAVNKRVDWVLRAFALVRERHPGATLDIVGNGPERERLVRLCEELGLGPSVRFLGYVAETDLGRVLGEMDAFAFASASETFGIVLAQAMSAGLPIAVTGSSCLPEVVEDGRNGFVGANSPEGLADAMLRLMDHPEAADRMARENRRKAVEEYDWNGIAAQYLQVFRHVAGKEPE